MTEKEIKALKPKEKRYKVYLGDCLFVEIMTSGSKFYRIKKGSITKTIGNTESFTMKEARVLSFDIVKEMSIITSSSNKKFHEVIEEFTERKEWSDRTYSTNTGRIKMYILPALKNVEVSEIKRRDILELLRKIEAQDKLETAQRVLGLIKQILDFAVVCDYIELNPALGLISALKKPKVTPMAAFTKESDIASLVQAVDLYPRIAVKNLLRFTMLTLCRPSECRLAKWDEIQGDTWTVPAERMKLRKEHVVPLSRQCLKIIEKMEAFKESDYIFPSTRPKRPLSDNTLLVALRIMGFAKEETTVHGFRSMGSTVLNEKGYRHDIIEKALAHAGEDRIRAIYNRAEYFEERKSMLQDYADYLDNLI